MVAAAGGEPGAVGVERHRPHFVGVTGQHRFGAQGADGHNMVIPAPVAAVTGTVIVAPISRRNSAAGQSNRRGKTTAPRPPAHAAGTRRYGSSVNLGAEIESMLGVLVNRTQLVYSPSDDGVGRRDGDPA